VKQIAMIWPPDGRTNTTNRCCLLASSHKYLKLPLFIISLDLEAENQQLFVVFVLLVVLFLGKTMNSV